MFSWSLILIGPFSCSSAFALHETVELSIGNFDLEKNCGAQNSKCTACGWSSDLNFELHCFRLHILYELSETLELRTRHRWSSGAFCNRTPRSQNHGSYRSKRSPGGQNYGSYCSKKAKTMGASTQNEAPEAIWTKLPWKWVSRSHLSFLSKNTKISRDFSASKCGQFQY